MNFIHTLWTKPLLYGNKKGKELKKCIEVTVFDYALSMRLIQFYGHTITLYTDKEGAKLLSPLPYNKVVVLPIQDQDIQFAAQIKFEALEICNEEDFIIDGDILLQKPEVYNKLQELKDVNDCIYSVDETFANQQEVMKNFQPIINVIKEADLLPGYKAVDKSIQYPNTSIMFIKNPELKKQYLDQYNYHKSILQGKDFKGVWPDIWIEQYFLGQLLNSACYSYSPVIKNYPNEEEAARLGITHLAGLKKVLNPYIQNTLIKTDILLYNEIVQHLQSIFKNIKI